MSATIIRFMQLIAGALSINSILLIIRSAQVQYFIDYEMEVRKL